MCLGRADRENFRKLVKRSLDVKVAFFSVFYYRQFPNKNYAFEVQLFIELLRHSNISPYEQYPEGVLTLLVFFFKAYFNYRGSEGSSAIGASHPNQCSKKNIQQFFPCCSLVVRPEEFSVCLVVGTEPQQAVGGRWISVSGET